MEEMPVRPLTITSWSTLTERARRDAGVLSTALTPLIGRETALAELAALLAEPDVRLVTLTGPPGIGKTRLAIAIAPRWQATTGHATYVIPLSAVTEPALVLPSVAYVLGLPATDDGSLVDRIAATLAERPTLLVLDNFEQVVAAAVDVVELLTACPSLTVLVTSRSPLRVRGEREWPVPPLTVPATTSDELPALASCPAVALLLDRARAVDPSLTLTKDNAATLAAICVRLEGIPLAIELAAARLNLFSPATLLERLERPLSILRSGARDLPVRHRTLGDAIAWSYSLLGPDEQRLFQRLAIFVDGWTLEAAQAVCDEAGAAGEQAVLDGLAALLEQSLVRREPGASGNPRFRMLELIREYALELLEQQPAVLRQVEARFAAYYLALVEEVAAHLYRADQAVWMARLEQEVGNLRLALRWLIDQGLKDEALRFGVALENFWLVHDHLSIGQGWLEEILAMPGEAHPLSMARARGALAALLVRRGELANAQALCEVALAFYREAGEEQLRAQALLDLGSIHFIIGDLAQGTADFEDALALARQVGDQRTVARALNRLGEVARATGDDAGSVAHYEESLAIWRALAEKERIAMVLHNLAPVVLRLGDRPRALAHFAESLALSWELRNRHGAALCLAGIAGAVGRGWLASTQAAKLLGAAAALREAIGVQWEPADQAEYERSVAAVRAHLDEAAFAAAWNQGQTMPLTEAVELAQSMLGRQMTHAGAPPNRGGRDWPPGGLSRREYEVVLQVALGKTNREIADILFIAEKTVETHISHCLSKLGVRSRAQLAAWVASQRLPAAP